MGEAFGRRSRHTRPVYGMGSATRARRLGSTPGALNPIALGKSQVYTERSREVSRVWCVDVLSW
jgi:hypothetical protein